MPASPFVYGGGYDQIAQQQMGLDQATTNRMLASQQMLREVQRAAVAQRQQEIAAYQQAQAQADQQAQRDQENQYRMAALIADYQNRNRSDVRYRDETKYAKEQDVLAGLFRDKQFKANTDIRTAEGKLAKDEFEWRKSQKTPAQIRQDEIDRAILDEDTNKTQVATNLANSLNKVTEYDKNISDIGDISKARSDSWFGNAFGGEYWRQLRGQVPYDMNVDPQELIKGKSWEDAVKTVQAIYEARRAPYKTQTESAFGTKAMNDVGVGPDGRMIPTYVPRSALTAPTATAPVNQPQVQSLASKDPGVQEVIRLMGTGNYTKAQAIEVVSQIVRAASAGMGGRMQRAY